MKIVSAGEILWDLIRGEEHLGGAPLNFAVSAHWLGHEVTLVSAVCEDERGRRAIARIKEFGLSAGFVRRVPHPTGTVTVTFDPAGEPDYVIHRPAAYDFLEPAVIEAEWIYYGTLIQTNPHARAAIAALTASIPNRFYDVNLRKHSYTQELVRELIAQSTAIKMNQQEAGILGATANLELFCRSFGKPYVCVTRGAAGCALLMDGDYAEVDGWKVRIADTVGAGDAFAAAFLHGIGAGWTAEQAGRYANRAGALAVTITGGGPAR